MSKIEWTEKTWNPIVGCSIVSPGCKNCYAMRMAARLEKMGVAHYQALTQRSNAGAVWTGRVALAPEKILLEPLRRRKPTMYFVNSMGDLFHEDVPEEWILRVLDVIRQASYDGGSSTGKIGAGEGEHTFQVLTKRSARMRSIMTRLRWDGERLHLLPEDDGRARVLLRNMWLGVSAERQQEADERVPDLLATPAAVRFVSAEPLLGPVDFNFVGTAKGASGAFRYDALGGRAFPWDGVIAGLGVWSTTRATSSAHLDWVIVGGESGPGARPMHPDWARSIRDQCRSADVPFFFKQWGEWSLSSAEPVRGQYTGGGIFLNPAGNRVCQGEWWDGNAAALDRLGKRRAGRLLDGREWNEMPEAIA